MNSCKDNGVRAEDCRNFNKLSPLDRAVNEMIEQRLTSVIIDIITVLNLYAAFGHYSPFSGRLRRKAWRRLDSGGK